MSGGGGKHRWTEAEDQLCCERYLARYVVERSGLDAASFLRELQRELPEVPALSLKMKLQNCKQLLRERGIADTLAVSPLRNYSKQNQRAMEAALRALRLLGAAD